MRRYLLSVLLVANSFAATAQDRFVPVEQRLSAAQLAEVGLDAVQLQTLNRVLREAEASMPATPARPRTPCKG